MSGSQLRIKHETRAKCNKKSAIARSDRKHEIGSIHAESRRVKEKKVRVCYCEKREEGKYERWG